MAELLGVPEYGPVMAITVPQANPIVEPEMQALLGMRYSLLAARMLSPEQDSRARLLDYYDRLGQTLDAFDVAPVAVAGFACTGSSYLLGRKLDLQRLDDLSARRDYPVVGAADAIYRALSRLNARKIALLTPYPSWLSEAGLAYWGQCGLELGSVAGLPQDLLDTRKIYSIKSSQVAQLLDGLDIRACDAVLISGTGMPTLRAMAQKILPVPVLSSNLCLAWAMQVALNTAASPDELLANLLSEQALWRRSLGGAS